MDPTLKKLVFEYSKNYSKNIDVLLYIYENVNYDDSCVFRTIMKNGKYTDKQKLLVFTKMYKLDYEKNNKLDNLKKICEVLKINYNNYLYLINVTDLKT